MTFTYPDSMASLPLARGDGHRMQRRPYHGHVFTLPEIAEVIAQHGLPRRDGAGGFDRFVEVQVWDDVALTPFVPLAWRRRFAAGGDVGSQS